MAYTMQYQTAGGEQQMQKVQRVNNTAEDVTLINKLASCLSLISARLKQKKNSRINHFLAGLEKYYFSVECAIHSFKQL